jgi:hypothetical protein
MMDFKSLKVTDVENCNSFSFFFLSTKCVFKKAGELRKYEYTL